MARRYLGHRTAQGAIDTQGINPYLPGTGWNVILDPGVLGTNLTELVVYHIALDGPIGGSARVLIDGYQWDYVSQAWLNGWDPSQPMPLWQGITVAFCFNQAFTSGPYNLTTNIRPIATLWLAHDVPDAAPILPGLGG
jgi:hypothetical protein